MRAREWEAAIQGEIENLEKEIVQANKDMVNEMAEVKIRHNAVQEVKMAMVARLQCHMENKNGDEEE